jgi:predicted kinase
VERIFLIAGGPGTGKSTTARALADTFERSVHIDVDEFRHMVRGGQVLPGVGEWSDELRHQVSLARETALDMTRRYAGAGFTVVIDDFWDPDDLREYDEAAADLDLRRYLLYPSAEEARRRNRVRSPGEEGDMIDTAIPWIYGHYAGRLEAMRGDGWTVLDTTGLDVEHVVEGIRDKAVWASSDA